MGLCPSFFLRLHVILQDRPSLYLRTQLKTSPPLGGFPLLIQPGLVIPFFVLLRDPLIFSLPRHLSKSKDHVLFLISFLEPSTFWVHNTVVPFYPGLHFPQFRFPVFQFLTPSQPPGSRWCSWCSVERSIVASHYITVLCPSAISAHHIGIFSPHIITRRVSTVQDTMRERLSTFT